VRLTLGRKACKILRNDIVAALSFITSAKNKTNTGSIQLLQQTATPHILNMVLSEACRRLSRDYLLAISKLHRCVVLDERIRDVILRLQLHRRGCRARNYLRRRQAARSTVTNVNNSRSADRSTHPIPTIVTARRVSDGGILYHGQRECRTAVRRDLLLDVRRCDVALPVTAIGLLNVKSVSSKSTVIYDRIIADRLHLCALVETWHDSADSPQLIACTPPGYQYIEKARPRTDSTTMTTLTNHGGLCLLHLLRISRRLAYTYWPIKEQRTV